MRKFVMLSPNFWIGSTGRDLRAAGTNAQLVAVYLISNPLTNYTGLYRLPIIYIANDLGLTVDATREALAAIEKTGFARYDEKSEYVWVLEAARHQLGEELKASDNKVKFVNKEFAALAKGCPFIADYYAKYATSLHLKARADVLTVQAPAKVEEAKPAQVVEAAKPAAVEKAATPAPVKEAAPVVVEDVQEAISEYAEEQPAWTEATAADDLADFLATREACGYPAAGAKAVAASILTFAAEHGDYCTRKLIERAASVDDYELTYLDMYKKEVLAKFDI